MSGTWDDRFRRRSSPEPTLALIETCWCLVGPSGRPITCGIYRDDGPGLEVRAGYSEIDLVKSQRTAEIGSARELAAQWRQAAIDKGFGDVEPTKH